MGGRIAASLPLALGAAGGLLSLAACGGEDPVVTPRLAAAPAASGQRFVYREPSRSSGGRDGRDPASV